MGLPRVVAGFALGIGAGWDTILSSNRLARWLLFPGVVPMPLSALGAIRRPPALVAFLLAAGVAARLAVAGDEGRKPGDAGLVQSARTPWTTSRVVGSPDPPRPFKVVRALPN